MLEKKHLISIIQIIICNHNKNIFSYYLQVTQHEHCNMIVPFGQQPQPLIPLDCLLICFRGNISKHFSADLRAQRNKQGLAKQTFWAKQRRIKTFISRAFPKPYDNSNSSVIRELFRLSGLVTILFHLSICSVSNRGVQIVSSLSVVMIENVTLAGLIAVQS